MKNRAVITATGVISPAGMNTDEFWNSCLQQKDYICPIPENWKHYSSFMSQYWSPLDKYFPGSEWLLKMDLLQLDFCQLMVLDAAYQAITASGISFSIVDSRKRIMRLECINPERAGVFIGTGTGGITSLLSAHLSQLLSTADHLRLSSANQDSSLKRYNPFTVPMMMVNGSADILGIRLSLHGMNRTVTAACSSGTMAIGEAYRAVAEGRLDFALAGGVEYLHDPSGGIFRGFDIAGTLTRISDPVSCNCPFDQSRSGFLFCEGGCAILMIESLEHAVKRGAKIIAEIKAYQNAFEAYNLMMMDPAGSHIENLLRSVVNQSGLKVQEIDYINAHGTGTVLNDQIESDVIDRVFGKEVPVNSTKSITGHALGASGALEAVVTALSVYYDRVHGSKNLRNPVRNLNFVKNTSTHRVKNALTESFAFGGHYAALVLGKV